MLTNPRVIWLHMNPPGNLAVSISQGWKHQLIYIWCYCRTVGGSVLLIDVPRRIKSLAECSREVINRKLATGDGTVTSLPIPTSVQDYLTYSRLQL